jgi:hypothetical protein
MLSLSTALLVGVVHATTLSSIQQTGAPPAAASTPPPSTGPATPEFVELAICLDTSGSMDGLIDAARARIWDIVSDLATATPQPKLRVALVTFGNDGHRSENGWTNIDIDFTDNLDVVSERLFSLTTNGGTELVGRVIDRATKGLAWSEGDASLRILVVAGNESADQDAEVKYGDAARRAIERMIVVNSIYCGAPTEPYAAAWQDVARKADGHFASIDQNNGTVVIATPFDEELARLSGAINATYVPYGEAGAWNASNQAAQDANAAGMNGAAAAQRCVTKGSGLYMNRGWDLVDACADPAFRLEEVKESDLPEAMRAMSPEARRAHIAERAAARAALQEEIRVTGERRAAFIAAELAKSARTDEAAFDRAIRNAIRAQATARGFTFRPDPVVGVTPAEGEAARVSTPAAG